MSDDLRHAPFSHPQQDPFLQRSRRLARLLQMVAQVVFVVGLLHIVRVHSTLGFPQFLFAVLGLFYINSRTTIMHQVFQAIADRTQGLVFTPNRLDVMKRALFLVIIPYAVLFYTLSRANESEIVYTGMALIAITEIVARLSGLFRWQTPRLHHDTFVHLIHGRLSDAAEAIAQARNMEEEDQEASLLAVASAAIKSGNVSVIRGLLTSLEGGHPTFSNPRQERIAAILRADIARLVDPATCAEDEARALMLVPPGHPRRLSLGLFVATAALEHDDPGSAMKALQMLHPRDVSVSSARVAVNWLLMKAAEGASDLSILVRCRRALRTFDLKKEVTRMNVSQKPDERDPYERWIQKAKDELPESVDPNKER